MFCSWFALKKRKCLRSACVDLFCVFFLFVFVSSIQVLVLFDFHRHTVKIPETIAQIVGWNKIKKNVTIFVSFICAYRRHKTLATKLMKLTNVQRVTVFIWPSSLPVYTLHARSTQLLLHRFPWWACVVLQQSFHLYLSFRRFFRMYFAFYFPFVRIFLCRRIGWRCVSHETVLICWIGFYPSRSSINYHVHFLSIKCK